MNQEAGSRWTFHHHQSLTTEKTFFWKDTPTGCQPLVAFCRRCLACLATATETSFFFSSRPIGRAAEPPARTPDLEPLGDLALCGHSLATCRGRCGWLGSESGVCTWGTDWPAGGTLGTGQPVRILGLGQMGMEEWGPWWSPSVDGKSSGKRGEKNEG